MKQFYPNKEIFWMGIIYLVVTSLLARWGISEIENEKIWVMICAYSFLGCMSLIFVVIGTLSVCIQKDCLIYKKTCFSKKRIISFCDIRCIVLEYRYRTKDITIFLNSENRFSCMLDMRFVKELLSLFSKESFRVISSSSRCIPEKHIGTLIKADLLDGKNAEHISEYLYYPSLHIDREQGRFTFKRRRLFSNNQILFEDIDKITFDYRHQARVWVFTRKNEHYYLDAEWEFMQELLSLIPLDKFFVLYNNKSRVPKKHRELLLTTGILSEEQREEFIEKSKNSKKITGVK